MLIETAARRYLLGLTEIAGFAGSRIYKRILSEPIEGDGTMAVVVSRQPGWASPDTITTQSYPRLAVDVYADPSRVPGTGEIAVLDAEDRAYGAAKVVRRWFTYPNLLGVRMGGFGSNPGLMVVNSALYAEPRILEGHGQQQGDVVAVRTEFALQVVDDG